MLDVIAKKVKGTIDMISYRYSTEHLKKQKKFSTEFWPMLDSSLPEERCLMQIQRVTQSLIVLSFSSPEEANTPPPPGRDVKSMPITASRCP